MKFLLIQVVWADNSIKSKTHWSKPNGQPECGWNLGKFFKPQGIYKIDSRHPAHNYVDCSRCLKLIAKSLKTKSSLNYKPIADLGIIKSEAVIADSFDLYPFCITCRKRMSKNGRYRNLVCYRCEKCGARANNESGQQRKQTSPASCLLCRRKYSLNGDNSEFFRCLNCKYQIRRNGIKRDYPEIEILACCLACRKNMKRCGRKNDRTRFTCAHCGVSLFQFYLTKPQILDKDLFNFVSSMVPSSIYFEVRNDVILEIYLEILKNRRANTGRGLVPSKLTADIVRQYLKQVRRAESYRFNTSSLDAPDYKGNPYSERLVG